jgi:HEAT repeat protein
MPAVPGFGVITLDLQLRISSWNEWMVATTGVPDATARGRNLTEFVVASRVDLIAEVLTDVVHSGVSRVLVPALHRFLFLCPPPRANADFQEMQQHVTLAPLRDETRIVGVLITVEDVTERLIGEREQARRLAAGTLEPAALVGADDWQVRAAATRSLTRSATPTDVAQLLEALEREHHNFSVLSGALQVLVAVHHDVTGPLVQLLKSPMANVRMHAALALGALGDQTSVRDLLQALGDDDVNVRFHVIEALGRLAAPDSVAELQRVAESGDFFLAFPAIDALARIDDAAVTPALLALARHEELRPAVVDALASLGDEDCVPVLVALLNDGRGDVAQVAAALERIARRYDETFGAAAFIVDATRAALSPEGVGRLAAAAAAGTSPIRPVLVLLGWVGEAGLDGLIGFVGHPDHREVVTDAILSVGAPAVPRLIAQLEQGARDARVAAAFLLGALGDARGTDALVAALAGHDNELVMTAARALAAIGDGGARESLLTLFAHPDVMVRQSAVFAVNSLGAAGLDARLQALIADAEPRVRECAVRASGYFAFDWCVDGIIEAVGDDAEDVRRAAIEQLPLLDDPRGLELLLAALRHETPRNRAAAAHALRLLDDDRVDAALVEMLADDQVWVRYFSAGSVAYRRLGAAAERLEIMALADPAPHVRIAAVQALALIDPRALLQVATTIVDDSDADIAAAALRGLGAVADRQVEQMLERAMHSPMPELRVAAAEALGDLGTSAAVQTLAWAARLPDPPALGATAVTSLCRLAGSNVAAAPTALAALVQLGLVGARRESVVQALSNLPATAIPILAAELHSPRADVRSVAVEGLARMRAGAATELVADALSDDDVMVRTVAIKAFGRLGSSSVADQIVAMSRHDPDPSIRRRANAVCRRYGWSTEARAGGER